MIYHTLDDYSDEEARRARAVTRKRVWRDRVEDDNDRNDRGLSPAPRVMGPPDPDGLVEQKV